MKKVSQDQIKANHANAQHSTGPKSAEGKPQGPTEEFLVQSIAEQASRTNRRDQLQKGKGPAAEAAESYQLTADR